MRMPTSTRMGIIAAAVALVATSCRSVSGATSSPTASPTVTRPNIVFVLTDDLSWNLVTPQIAPHIVALQKRGETFSNYFVSDSLCCPSRSSIFTGRFPHDTRVVTNPPPDGGFQQYQKEHLDRQSFAIGLQHAGYATSMLGKYLNGYGDPKMTAATAPVPPGWSDWHVSNDSGYAEFNYFLNDNGKVNLYRGADQYGVDVLNSDARAFIKRSAAQPFMVEVATFAPHAPYTPALRNANDFPGLHEPQDPSFDTNNEDPPAWLGQRTKLRTGQLAQINTIYRRRAQAVEAVDKLVADVEATLAAQHLTQRTYIVFSSDNGYHLGQHRLVRGKQTAFDTDIRVPLVVAGPGVPAGRTVSQVAQNVDLNPTFLQLAGQEPAAQVDGHSLVALLHPSGATPAWRTAALVEHHGDTDPADPDFDGGGSNPTTYEAVRISAPRLSTFPGAVDAVYVEYRDHAHELEYYDVSTDRYERHNIAGELTAPQRATLHRILAALEHCHTGSACWAAARPG